MKNWPTTIKCMIGAIVASLVSCTLCAIFMVCHPDATTVEAATLVWFVLGLGIAYDVRMIIYLIFWYQQHKEDK